MLNSPIIVFDIGNVLLEWDPRLLYRKLLPNDIAIQNFLIEVDFFRWNLEQDRGRTFAEGIKEACLKFPQHCGLLQAYHDRYEESIAGSIQGSVSILNRLHQAGYSLYALSNFPADKFRIVRARYSFFDLFNDFLISGEVGLVKPDPLIYKLLLERTGSRADACLFIDDSLANILAAQALGFNAIQFHSPEQLEYQLNLVLQF